MTPIDLAIAGFVVVGALVGLWLGAFKQVVHFLAWAAAAASVYFAAGAVAVELQRPLGVPYFVSYAFAAAGLFLLVNLAVRLLLFLPAKLREKKDDEGPTALGLANRLGGALIGAGKSTFYAWAILSVVVLVPPALKAIGPSAFATGAKKYNLVGWAFADQIAALKEAVARTPPKVQAQRTSLAKDTRFTSIAQDPGLREALSKGDLGSLAQSPDVVALLNDREAMERVMGLMQGNAATIDAVLAQ